MKHNVNMIECKATISLGAARDKLNHSAYFSPLEHTPAEALERILEIPVQQTVSYKQAMMKLHIRPSILGMVEWISWMPVHYAIYLKNQKLLPDEASA